jgi:hypothetical protein
MSLAGIGKVIIKPLTAKLTHDTEFFGKMDPYVKISSGPSDFRSKTHQNGGKFPSWKDEFTMYRRGETLIHLEVWDEDSVKKDDLVGDTDIPLAETFSKGKTQNWYTLSYDGKDAGKILVYLEWLPEPTEQKSQQPGGSLFLPQSLQKTLAPFMTQQINAMNNMPQNMEPQKQELYRTSTLSSQPYQNTNQQSPYQPTYGQPNYYSPQQQPVFPLPLFSGGMFPQAQGAFQQAYPQAGGYQQQGGYQQPPAGGYQQPAAGGYQQPPSGGYQQPPGGGYQQPGGYQQGGYQQPGAYQQPPAGGYQQPPAGGYQQPPAGGYQQPPAGGYQQPPAGGYQQPPAGGYQQPPAGGYQQPPAGGYQQPPAGSYQQPASGAYQQPPSGGFGGGYQQPQQGAAGGYPYQAPGGNLAQSGYQPQNPAQNSSAYNAQNPAQNQNQGGYNYPAQGGSLPEGQAGFQNQAGNPFPGTQNIHQNVVGQASNENSYPKETAVLGKDAGEDPEAFFSQFKTKENNMTTSVNLAPGGGQN